MQEQMRLGIFADFTAIQLPDWLFFSFNMHIIEWFGTFLRIHFSRFVLVCTRSGNFILSFQLVRLRQIEIVAHGMCSVHFRILHKPHTYQMEYRCQKMHNGIWPLWRPLIAKTTENINKIQTVHVQCKGCPTFSLVCFVVPSTNFSSFSICSPMHFQMWAVNASIFNELI